jgi:succinate dehydrogenase / fumarate reductase flavoprotein subunit
VYLDIASQRNADFIRKKLPSMYEQFLRLANVNITKEPMEVGPTAHYIMGGVRVDAATTESSVRGLFAAGEVAAGFHGANRLGGNSLSDLLVFGKRAGEYAAKYCSSNQVHVSPPNKGEIKRGCVDVRIDTPSPNLSHSRERVESAIQSALTPFDQKTNPENPYHLQQELKVFMDRHCGIIRSHDELEGGLLKLHELKNRAQNVFVANTDRTYHAAWHAALDLRSLLIVSELMLRAALERCESRGAHTRDDFPNEDPVWGKKNVIVKKEKGGITIRHEPISDMPKDLKALIIK